MAYLIQLWEGECLQKLFPPKPETIKGKMDEFKCEEENFLYNEINIKGKRNKLKKWQIIYFEQLAFLEKTWFYSPSLNEYLLRG